MKFLWGVLSRAKKVASTIYVQPSTEFEFTGGMGTVYYIFADTGNLLVTVPDRNDTFEVAEDGRIVANTLVTAAQRAVPIEVVA